MAISLQEIMSMIAPLGPAQSRPNIGATYTQAKQAKSLDDYYKAQQEQAKADLEEKVTAREAGEAERAEIRRLKIEKDHRDKSIKLAEFLTKMDPTDPRQVRMAQEAMKIYSEQLPGLPENLLGGMGMAAPGMPGPAAPPPSQVGMGAMVAGPEGAVPPTGEDISAFTMPQESAAARDISMAAPGLGLAPLLTGEPEAQPTVPEEPSLEELMRQATGTGVEQSPTTMEAYTSMKGGRELEFDEGNPYGPIPPKQEVAPQPDMMAAGGLAPGMVGLGAMQPTGTFGQLIQSLAGPEPTTDDVKAVRDMVATSAGLKPKLEASERPYGNAQVTTFYDDGVPLGSMNTTWMTPKDKKLLGIAAKAAAEDDPAAGAWAVGELTGDKKEALKFIKDIARNINRQRNVKGARGMSRKTKDRGNKEAAKWMDDGRNEVQQRYLKPKTGGKAFFELRNDIESARGGLKMASDPKVDLTNLIKRAQFAIAKTREPGSRLSDMDIKATEGMKSLFQQAKEIYEGRIKLTPRALRTFIKRYDTELSLLQEEVEVKLAAMYETEEKNLLSAVNEAQYMGLAKSVDTFYGGRKVRGYKKLRASRKKPRLPYSVPVPMDPEYLAQEAKIEEAAKQEEPTEAEDIMKKLDAQFGYEEMSLEK